MRADFQSTTQRHTITGALPASLTDGNIVDNDDVDAANAYLDALYDSEPSVQRGDGSEK